MIGTTLKTRSISYKADLLASVGKILFGEQNDGIQPGITPVIDQVFPMS